MSSDYLRFEIAMASEFLAERSKLPEMEATKLARKAATKTKPSTILTREFFDEFDNLVKNVPRGPILTNQ